MDKKFDVYTYAQERVGLAMFYLEDGAPLSCARILHELAAKLERHA